jgi:hypothetical protein
LLVVAAVDVETALLALTPGLVLADTELTLIFWLILEYHTLSQWALVELEKLDHLVLVETVMILYFLPSHQQAAVVLGLVKQHFLAV